MKGNIFLFILTFLFLEAAAQMPSRRPLQDTISLYNKKEFAIFVGPAYANLINESRQKDEYATTTGSLNINIGFNYCKHIKKNMAVNFGAEFSRYQNLTSYKGHFRKSTTSVDRDGYIYYPTRVANYTEKRTVIAVEIPVLLRLKTPVSRHAYYFIDVGIKTQLLAYSNISVEGTLEKKGTYPLQGTSTMFALIENDPYHGYVKSTYSSSKIMKTAVFALSLMGSTGVVTRLNDETYMVVSPSYIYGLTDISSPEQEDYENIFQEKSPYTKLTLSQIGLRVGLVLKL